MPKVRLKSTNKKNVFAELLRFVAESESWNAMLFLCFGLIIHLRPFCVFLAKKELGVREAGLHSFVIGDSLPARPLAQTPGRESIKAIAKKTTDRCIAGAATNYVSVLVFPGFNMYFSY